ncbi:DUF3303 domain-containing protein [Chloroflexota bacterium]
MLFHITHIHTPETCPYHNPEKARATFGKMLSGAEQFGVKLVGVWIDAPAHTAYMVVETDSSQKIEELLAPAFEIAHAETRVVQDGKLLLQRRVE